MTVYLSEAYHPALGFINGFSCFILTCSGSIASLAMAAVESFRGTLGLNDLAVKIIAILIIIVFTAVNLRGAKLGVAFQNFTMVARVIPLVLIIFLGIFLGDNSVDMSLSMEGTRAEGGGITGAISLIGFATFASLWAYEGWTNLNTVGEEMKNPKREPAACDHHFHGIHHDNIHSFPVCYLQSASGRSDRKHDRRRRYLPWK